MRCSYHLLIICSLFISQSCLADIKQANDAYQRQDYQRAFEEYSLLAKQGDSNAQAKLGIMFFWGRGTLRNDYQAYFWSLKAARSGQPEAQQMLGYLYENGIYIPQNINRAIDWYQKAMQQNNWSAAANLANIYMTGKEGHQDLKRALFYAKKAAENDDAFGQYLIASIYKTRQKDYLLAKHWFEKSAQQGNASAASELAMIYLKGLGEPTNLRQALFWFMIAEEYNDPEAHQNRMKIQTRVTYEDVLNAQASARKWLKEYSLVKN